MAFLGSLQRESMVIAPQPVIIDSDAATIDISLHGTPPRNAPLPFIHWQLFCGQAAEPMVQGLSFWPLQESIPLWVADTYQLICEVDIEGVGSRVLTRRFTAREGSLDSMRALADDELLDEQDALRERLATESDPSRRRALQKNQQNARWLIHERGIQSHAAWARTMDAAQDRLVLPDDAAGMRSYVEQCIASYGRTLGGIVLGLSLRGDEVASEQRALGYQQLSLLIQEAGALEREFESKAMRIAWQLLQQSSRQIGDILRGYGLSLHLDDLVRELVENDGEGLDAIAEELLARSKDDIARPPGTYEGQANEREQLSTIAGQLHAKQVHLHELYAERRALMQHRDNARPVRFDAGREHPSHHRERDPLRDPRFLGLFDRIDEGSLATHSPEFAGLVNLARRPDSHGSQSIGQGDPEKVIQLDLWVSVLDADIRRAQIDYKTRWLEAEQVHPILVTYREKPGTKADLGPLLGGDDDQIMLGVLRDILPKLANIARAQYWLTTGDLDPLELPPVVELAKQSLLIVPGTMRDKIVDDVVEDATDDLKEWAIAAVALGLAVLTVVPSGGSSAVLLVELGGLAFDVYLAMESCNEFTIQSAAADTSIDPSLALSREEPTLTWLAVELMATGLGAAFVIKTFREAARLRRSVEAGESAQAAMRHLDELGEGHGLGKIGSRVVEDAGDGFDIVRRTARPALYSDRVGYYAAENIDGLACRLGAGVEVDPILGSGVRIDRFVHDDGDVWVIGLRVGPDATTADVLAHGQTIELMRRYNGIIGDLRAVLDRGLGRAVHKAGSAQEIASLEAEKLRRLLRERQRTMSAIPADSVADVLEQEIAFLQKELADWEVRLLSREPDRVVSGFGEIGSPNFHRAGRVRATKAYEEVPEYFPEPIHGVEAKYRWVSDQHGHKVKRYLVEDEDSLLRVAENAAGGSLDNFVEIKPNWYEGEVDGQKIKIEWQPGGEPVMNEGPHVKIQVWDPGKGKGGKWLAPEKIFIDGKETLHGNY